MSLSHRQFIFILFLILGGISLIIAFPGSMSPDSTGALLRAKIGVYNEAKPMGWSFLWGLLDRWIYPGPMSFIGFNILLFIAALILFFNEFTKTRRQLVLTTSLVLFYPAVFTIFPIAWRDVTGVSITMLSLVLAIFIHRTDNKAHKYLMFGGLILCCIAGCLFRYNHAAGALPILVYGAWPFVPTPWSWPKKMVFTAGLSLTALAAMTAGAMHFTNILADSPIYHRQARKNFMLASMSVRLDRNLFPKELYPDTTLDHIKDMLEDENAYAQIFWRGYSQKNNKYLPRITTQEDYKTLSHALMSSIVQHPVTFLSFRFDEFLKWTSLSEDFGKGSVLVNDLPDKAKRPDYTINYPTKRPAWSKTVLKKWSELNRNPLNGHPVWMLFLSGILCLVAWRKQASTTPVLIVTWLCALFHFMGIAGYAFAHSFRLTHQSLVFCVIGVALFLLGTALSRKSLDSEA